MHLNKSIDGILLIGLLSVFFIHCSSDDTVLPKTENETFNKLLLNAPATIINIDEVPVDTIIVTSEQTLGTETSSYFSEPVYLEFPATSFIKLDDTFYVANQQKIYAMDKEGVWQRSVGRQGKGPGEFASSLKITRNSQHIIAFDYSNGRIQVFDHNLNLLFVRNKNLHDALFGKNFALNNHFLYLGLVPHSNDALIEVYRTDDLKNRIEMFWPKIIPDGLQPGPYNGILIDVNTIGNIVVTNIGLPYLFLLKPDRKIKHILYFESSYYQELENPSVKPAKVEGNTEHTVPGVGSFIKQIRINDDGSIYFTVFNNLYHIIVDENNDYRLLKAWHFIHADPFLREDSPKGIDIGSMTIEEDTIYFVSLMGGYVFRVPLNE